MSGVGKARSGTAKERSVFVGNIPYDVTEEMLKEIFSGAGSVINFRLVTDRETGKPKGYGFCEYADGATALSAMRNLNGYEINGRNLRVDFADGGEKSSSSNDKSSSSVSGEVIIQAIEAAITKFGPVKLYDMLVELKEHARQRPDYTKTILMANPALTHAIVQCFKTLNIPIPAANESQPALLSAPPHLQVPPPGRGAGPILRSPAHAVAGGGILGMAPPGSASSSANNTPMGNAPANLKPSGSRWSAPRGGPPPNAPPPVPHHEMPPPPMSNAPPPMPASSHQRSRDPRARARDPRLNKRAAPDAGSDMKRSRPEDHGHSHGHGPGPAHGGPPQGEYDAIAELARDMTPQKMNMLAPNERQIVLAYMQQYGIPFSSS
ncbi:TPA: hypothetical protein N0F65_011529 [Lagenidium giganteum]|uniref:RRM domain-containing protein n=1 Tax=Lagenidium giganteum TaxID=4803 RepID=A0AAV2Z2G0_9STRA|nr:TPA: hypothetical protein N0F65_011529 [Lagenidium giganteum]